MNKENIKKLIQKAEENVYAIRGYDVTTMKFEISPKLPNYERFNGLSKKYCRKEK